MSQMISQEEAREIVLGRVQLKDIECVPLLDAAGRVAARDLKSDIDNAPFANSAMDGFAVRSAMLEGATEEAPVLLKVVGHLGAGDVFEGPLADDECVRIMTGAALPDAADSVVKYEIVGVESGDGKTGSVVSFTAPTKHRSNVREAGEEAKAGEVVVSAGEVITSGGVGFLATCGVVEVPVRERPRVAILATGSELVPADTVPTPGKIRNSNSYAMAACVRDAGGIPDMLPIVEDTYEALAAAVKQAAASYDFVVTTGGAADGDFDFIKRVVNDLGELLVSTVKMRPGKAQTFGIVDGTPVFGLPGNPAAAYMGFQLIVRPALRKMQGFTHFDFPRVRARLTRDAHKRDARRLYMRATLVKDEDGTYQVTPIKNQSSGLFGPIHHSNCIAVIPEDTDGCDAGTEVDCLLMDVSEEVVL